MCHVQSHLLESLLKRKSCQWPKAGVIIFIGLGVLRCLPAPVEMKFESAAAVSPRVP